MKFTKPLDDIFQTPSSVKVLRVLLRAEMDMTGRQIAELAGLNPQTTLNTLDRLDDLNLLAVRKVARARLYKLRSGHALIEKLIRPLFDTEKTFLNDQLSAIGSKLSRSGLGATVILFGSVARGGEGPDSDLDLCILINHENERDKINRIVVEVIDDVVDTTGNVPTILVWLRNELIERLNNNDKLATSIINEGRVIGGPDVIGAIQNG
jgi:predicted nucleotidyltransferase